MSDATLLTGATGFVGMAVLARLLERDERPVVVLVRADDQEQADARLDDVLSAVCADPEEHTGRVRAVAGDLELPGLGLDGYTRVRVADEVGEIVHAAASVSFELPLDASRAINVAGTRRMLDLAHECAVAGDGLRRFTYVSTAYVAGTRSGTVHEHELDAGQDFRNAYEHSKHEAEQLVQACHGELPVTVVRPSIVVGERGTGWTTSFNVMYGPLRAFSLGAYPVVPGRRRAHVDIVTVDHLADAIVALAAAPEARGGTFHVVGGDNATTLGEMADLSARRFGRRMPRFVPPRIYRHAIQPLLLRRSDARRSKALKRTAIYLPYFSLRLRFDDRRARALLDPLGIRATPIAEHFDEIVDFALAAGWGRRPISRVQAHAIAREARDDEARFLREPAVAVD
jgi:thioester reductase-like protein